MTPGDPLHSLSSACTASSAMWPGWRLRGRTCGTSKRRWVAFCTPTPSTRHWGAGLMGTQEWPSLPLMVQWRREKPTPRRRDVTAPSGTGTTKWSEGWVEVAVVTFTVCMFKEKKTFSLMFCLFISLLLEFISLWTSLVHFWLLIRKFSPQASSDGMTATY